jgi:polygalacturonase
VKAINAVVYLLFASGLLSASVNAATYHATDLGVKADGTTNNAKELQKIIDRCSTEGGGTVVIDKGTVVSGMLYLKDKVTLEIAEGATLKCTGKQDDYPYVPVDFDTYYPERRAFIYAQNQQNIAVVGTGKIDGNRPAFPNGSESDRVSLIRFDGCKDVSITGVTLFEASMWTTHIYRCDRVEIADLTIDNARGIRVLNDDGINIDGSSNVRIKNCIINTRDDCITMKNTSRQGCKNVEIDNCTLATKKSGLKFGTESFTGFENITARNLDIWSIRDYRGFVRIRAGGTDPCRMYSCMSRFLVWNRLGASRRWNWT